MTHKVYTPPGYLMIHFATKMERHIVSVSTDWRTTHWFKFCYRRFGWNMTVWTQLLLEVCILFVFYRRSR